MIFKLTICILFIGVTIAEVERPMKNRKQPWDISPDVNRDQDGNTNAGVEVARQGEKHDMNKGWHKTVHGPAKAKPTWLVGGTIRFKRSPKHKHRWEVKPDISRTDNGNTNAGIDVNNKGKNHELNAGWHKTVRGPGKAKPSWHVGGTFRFRRSPNQPWEVKPDVSRTDDGNTNAGVEVTRKGENSEVNAGWHKTVHGPGKAKPTWHVGGTIRFKRSPKHKHRWEVKPDISRTDNGNTNAGIEVNNKGKNHELNAGWHKTVKGPGKAKPSWHVGGTFRFRRSLEENA